MLHTASVAEGTLALIRKLTNDPIFKDFHLVGGTALSLQIGHRISEDIDLFSQGPFIPLTLAQHLHYKYESQRTQMSGNGVFSFINSVKVDMLSHQYPLVKPLLHIEGVRMASLEDIAAMKINAIVRNGTRFKDFVDIHALLEHLPLQQMLIAYGQKYPDLNQAIALMSLTYFKDIEQTTIQYLGLPVTRQQIEQRILEAAASPTKRFPPRIIPPTTQKPLPKQKPDDDNKPKKRRGPKL